MRRKASVAGYFYPSDRNELLSFISDHLYTGEKKDACAVLVPHAGYVYSGATAVKTLSQVNIPDTVILAGPNHTGQGAGFAVYPEGVWETPLGDVETDNDLINKLCSFEPFTRDTAAHAREHSLEVMLPILKYLNPSIKVVCITMQFCRLKELRQAGKDLYEALNGENYLLLISSDMNHFENSAVTEKKDSIAIQSLLKMDENALYNQILDYNISMCGIAPACMGLAYCKLKGSDEAFLVEHTHSGAASGDYDSVVGYAGIIFLNKRVNNES